MCYRKWVWLTKEHGYEEEWEGDPKDGGGDVEEPVGGHGEQTKRQEDKQKASLVVIQTFLKGVEPVA